MKFQIELTGSQLMALRQVLIDHMSSKGSPEVYVDCSQDPPVETTPEELLNIFADALPANHKVTR